MKRMLLLLALIPSFLMIGCRADNTATAPLVVEPTGATETGTEKADVVTLTILCTDDLHDRSTALPYIARYVRELRTVQDNVLLLDAGDRVNKGELAFKYSRGKAIYELMNACGYDAGIIGNHGGSFGSAALAALIDSSNHPILGANMTWPKEIRPRNVMSHKTFLMDGVRVAVAGCTAEARNHSADDLVKIARVQNTLTQLVPKLQQQADIVVVITHKGNEADVTLARAVPGIDVIIGGHSHSSYEDMHYDEKSETIIHKAGAYGRLGEVVLKWDGKQIVARHAGIVKIDRSKGGDPAVAAVRKKWSDALAEPRVLAKAPAPLSAGQLAAWLADRVQVETGADLVLLAGDSVKLGLPAGDVRTDVLLKSVPRLAIVTADVPDTAALVALRTAVMLARPGTLATDLPQARANGPRTVALVMVSYDRPLSLQAIGLAGTPPTNIRRLDGRSLWQAAVEAARELKTITVPAPGAIQPPIRLPSTTPKPLRPAA